MVFFFVQNKDYINDRFEFITLVSSFARPTQQRNILFMCVIN